MLPNLPPALMPCMIKKKCEKEVNKAKEKYFKCFTSPDPHVVIGVGTCVFDVA